MNYNEKSITGKRKKLYASRVRGRTAAAAILFYLIFLLALTVTAGAAGFLYGSFTGVLEDIPEEYSLEPKETMTMIYDDQKNNVQQLSDYYSKRIIVDNAPDNLKNAFIAIEDERFYEHNGIDLRGIIRALITDMKSGSASQGASTITQQLIKNNVFDTGRERHFISRLHRKIQEQCMALDVERNYSKETILMNYLNTINLGKGNLGVEAAADYYFGKHASELTTSECAVLAGITKNPSALNPVDYPEANAERRKLVLKKMYDLRFITNDEYQTALNEDVYPEIISNSERQKVQSVYSYFTDALITRLVDDLQSRKKLTQAQAYNLVYRGGLQIYSTQDSDLQAIADSVINDKNNYPVKTKYDLEYNLTVVRADGSEQSYSELDVRDYFRKKNKKDYETTYKSVEKLKRAVAVFKKATVKEGETVSSETINYAMQPQLSYTMIDQKTGQVKVIVGGRGEKQDDLALNRATSVKRQPGSTFKILAAYAPAIDSGKMTLATTFEDAPFKYSSGKKVDNFLKGHYEGMLTIRDAITDSNNIVAVKTLTKITPQVGFDYLKTLGFTTLVSNRTGSNGGLESDINQSLALGGITDGVTNLELTGAYAAIANRGEYNKPILYTQVTDNEGNVILENKPSPTRVMQESTSWLLTSAMEDVVAKGTGVEAQLKSSMSVAGKTGTSSNNYDYWFCGFTPYYTASIWTGYDYNTNLQNDKDYHKVIWKKIMDKVNDSRKLKATTFPACNSIEKKAICIKSGKLPIDYVCSNDPEHSMVRTEYFAKGTVPKDTCDSHISVRLCTKTGHVAGKYCPKTHTRVYRLKHKGASKKTEDANYFLRFDPKNYGCTVHTKKWKEEHDKKVEERKKKEKEEQEKKKQQLREDEPHGLIPGAKE